MVVVGGGEAEGWEVGGGGLEFGRLGVRQAVGGASTRGGRCGVLVPYLHPRNDVWIVHVQPGHCGRGDVGGWGMIHHGQSGNKRSAGRRAVRQPVDR